MHATDATNAARTGLFNIHTGEWDDALIRLYGIPAAILPEVRDTLAAFGSTAAGLLDSVTAIGAMAGDQQAASSATPACGLATSNAPTAPARS